MGLHGRGSLGVDDRRRQYQGRSAKHRAVRLSTPGENRGIEHVHSLGHGGQRPFARMTAGSAKGDRVAMPNVERALMHWTSWAPVLTRYGVPQPKGSASASWSHCDLTPGG